ncbi:MAG: hypothetical protein WA081_14565 [Desulfosalsimonadaceae bacterium]
MSLIILSLVFIAAGIVVWIVGSRVNRRAAGKQQSKAQQKKYRRMAEKLSTAARIIFVLAAVSFIFGFILLQGSRL